MRLTRRKSKICAPALIYFMSALNEKGKKQLCVFGECTYGGTRVGPIWSHTRAAVSRCLATMTHQCPCGRRYHKHRYTKGKRIVRNDA